MTAPAARPCAPPSRARTPYESLVAALADDLLRERAGEPASPCLPDAYARWMHTTFGAAEDR